MAKSRSQVQKEYREREKLKEGKSYLKKELTRVLKYYVPANELENKDRKRRIMNGLKFTIKHTDVDKENKKQI